MNEVHSVKHSHNTVEIGSNSPFRGLIPVKSQIRSFLDSALGHSLTTKTCDHE